MNRDRVDAYRREMRKAISNYYLRPQSIKQIRHNERVVKAVLDKFLKGKA